MFRGSVARLLVLIAGVLSLRWMPSDALCAESDQDLMVDLYLYDYLSNYTLSDPRASASYVASCGNLEDALSTAHAQIALANYTEMYLGLSTTTLVHTLDRGYAFSNLTMVTVSGMGDGEAVIQCSNQVGLAFQGVDEVRIDRVKWTECGSNSTTDTLRGVALYLSDVATLNMTKSQFYGSYGSAVVVNMSKPQIYNYFILNCTFENNGKMVKGNGGAILFRAEPNVQETISFVHTDFIGNAAMKGGAVFLDLSQVEIGMPCTFNRVSFVSCNFTENEAQTHGGAVVLGKETAVFQDCTFLSNQAGTVGGAVHLYLYPHNEMCDQERVLYDSCVWKNNKADGSAAIYLSTASKLPQITVQFYGNNFTHNKVSEFSFFGDSSCIMYVADLNVQFEDVTFDSNHGSGVCLESSQLKVSGHIIFNLNEGYEGGAIYSFQSSYINLTSNTTLDFHNNLAIYGGAVYHKEDVAGDVVCVFDFKNANNATVNFVSNTAFTSGMAIYLVAPSEICKEELDLPQITFNPNDSNKASSSAQSINFGLPVYEDNDGTLYLDIILGQQLVFNVTIKDYFGFSTSLLVNMFVSQADVQDHKIPPYHLNGSTAFLLETGTNYPNVSIRGPDPSSYSSDTNLVLQLIGASTIQKINLHFEPCPLGFTYNSTDQKCQCLSLDDMICDLSNEAVCIREGYWFGEVNGTEATAICSSGFCTNVFGLCTRCSINGYEGGFCQIWNGTLAIQCTTSRSGPLCAECDANSNFTFAAVKCAPDDTCKQFNTFFLIALNFLFMLIMVFVVLVILKLGYNISSGYMFSIVYYFSIINHLLPLNVVGERVLILLSVFQGITQLKSTFIGYIPWCFSQNFKALELNSLLYLNPLIIGFSVFAFLIVSKYCRHYMRFSDSTPIRAICLLMLCSFTTLTETSFAILMPTTFEGVNEVYVNIQPSTTYLNLKQHLVWFLIALVVMVFLILPVTLLLLLAPFLSRYTNLTKFKPFLDEFQSCYKDKYRWMASYYFICRLLYLSIFTSAAAGLESTQYTIQVISLGVLVIHTLLQPYRKQVLNSVDTIILADIAAVSLLHGESANLLFQEKNNVRKLLTATLIIIPIFYLICGAFVAFARRYGLKKRIRKWLRRHSTQGKYFYKLSRHLNDPLLGNETFTEIPPTSLDNRSRSASTLSNSTRYREPFFRYLGFEDSDYQQDSEGHNSNEHEETECHDVISSLPLSQPTSSIVTLDRQASPQYNEEGYSPSHTSLRNRESTSNTKNDQYTSQRWLEQTTATEEEEL